MLIKDNKQKFLNKFLNYFFSLIIWPSLAFFFIAIVMLFIQIKSVKIFQEWVSKNRSFINDIFLFWKINTRFRNIGILIIVLGSLFFLIILNYKSWIAILKAKITKNNHPEKKTWEYNQFLKEGSFRKFKNNFKPGNPNFIFGNLKTNNFKKYDYLVNNLNNHAIVLGITGSGKTQKVLIPNLHYNASLENDLKPNIVITDPKKEILKITGEMFLEKGYEIKVFDFIDAKNSLHWNPLEQIWNRLHNKSKEDLDDDDYSAAFEQIIEITNSLNWPKGEDSKTMWVNQAKNVIITVIKFMLLYSLEDETFTIKSFTLSNVIWFLDDRNFKRGIWTFRLKSFSKRNHIWWKFHEEWNALQDIFSETFSGILTHASNVLLEFQSNLNIQKITSHINFSIDKTIRNNQKPWVIFICFPDHKPIFNFLINILITQIYREAIEFANSSPGRKLSRMLQFYLEEFNSLNIPQISDWMAISRSRNILFLLVIQAFEQLQKYGSDLGSWKSIQAQVGLIYFLETNSDETLEWFSKMLGEKTIKKESVTFDSKNKKTTTVSEYDKAIMTPAELKYKQKEMTIISCGFYKPIAINIKPAYEYLEYEEYVHHAPKIEINDSEIWDFNLMKLLNFNKNDEVNKEAINKKPKKPKN